jgi:hypothetical protein
MGISEKTSLKALSCFSLGSSPEKQPEGFELLFTGVLAKKPA